MRETTKKRLLAVLEADLRRIVAKINADHFASYNSANEAIRMLGLRSSKFKTQKQFDEATLQMNKLQNMRDKAWAAIKQQTDNLRKWMDEQFEIEQEISTLKILLSYDHR